MSESAQAWALRSTGLCVTAQVRHPCSWPWIIASQTNHTPTDLSALWTTPITCFIITTCDFQLSTLVYLQFHSLTLEGRAVSYILAVALCWYIVYGLHKFSWWIVSMTMSSSPFLLWECASANWACPETPAPSSTWFLLYYPLLQSIYSAPLTFHKNNISFAWHCTFYSAPPHVFI